MALVLVVDDEFLIRSVTVDMAERAGHTVLDAANAADAVQILESREDIEIVFSDVMLPGALDGISLVGMIRIRWPSIRAILTSGKACAAGREVPNGISFLPKPYTFEALTRVLANA